MRDADPTTRSRYKSLLTEEVNRLRRRDSLQELLAYARFLRDQERFLNGAGTNPPFRPDTLDSSNR